MEKDVLAFDSPKERSNYIKVIGVGGAGTNAVSHMYNEGIYGVDFIVCNTDLKSLNTSPVPNKIKIGRDGLGAGNKPERGKEAALASETEIKEALKGANMVFVAAGMGGGTGTGAAPVIAKFAKEMPVYDDNGEEMDDEILVVGVVTLPLKFEGPVRKRQAKAGIEELKKVVDSIIIVDTEKIREKGNIPMIRMFPLADSVLLTASKGIAEIITSENAYMQVDFRDIQQVMAGSGVALMGLGRADGKGPDRARNAIEMAANSELLHDCDLRGTKNILMKITTSSTEEHNMSSEELEIVEDYIQNITEGEPDIIWGLSFDDNIGEELEIIMIATGFEENKPFDPHVDEKRKIGQVDAPESGQKEEEIEIEAEPAKAEVEKIESKEDSLTEGIQIIEKRPIEKAEKPEKTEEAQEIVVHRVDEEGNLISSVSSQTYSQEESEMKAVAESECEVAESPITNQDSSPRVEKDGIISFVREEAPAITHHNTPYGADPVAFVGARENRMKQIARKLRDKSGVEEVINVPAYEQAGLEIDHYTEKYSEEETSRISLKDGKFISNNSFLNDNPD